ncbi:hypothetical protein [Paracoccus albus]|uniref:hypothetical protein n=1 Tax=Paracoccus albus TaxID=3017784 RepID=UPI0022F073BF|nr:hypothetical protein [Paracoccus albus]WBU59733.1 hypothetical protein PAF20_13375 [Paracoccus albus]
MRFLLAISLIVLPGLACAVERDPSALCEWAAQQAAVESGVPPDILAALTLTETGRNRKGVTRPWPWSVNDAGTGSWFDDASSALSYAEAAVSGGKRNLDIGCFQLNYRWHGMHFGSLDEMFDPLSNARYAARFVGQLKLEMGDWRSAAGAFHSRTPAHAKRYLARFDTFRAGLQATGLTGAWGQPETYNRFTSVIHPSGQPSPRGPRRARQPDGRMLLGAPQGTGRTGMPGSLATLADARATLLVDGHSLINGGRGPLFGPKARAVTLPRDRRTMRSHPDSEIPQINEEALRELMAAPPQGSSYPAGIPDGGRARNDLVMLGETPL